MPAGCNGYSGQGEDERRHVLRLNDSAAIGQGERADNGHDCRAGKSQSDAPTEEGRKVTGIDNRCKGDRKNDGREADDEAGKAGFQRV